MSTSCFNLFRISLYILFINSNSEEYSEDCLNIPVAGDTDVGFNCGFPAE